jgi:hypothetical protein
MAPDSKRVTEVLGSSMAGTRPLGLRDSKGSVLGWVLEGLQGRNVLCCVVVKWSVLGLRTFVQVAEVLEFGLVGDVELVEDNGYFPWVGAL